MLILLPISFNHLSEGYFPCHLIHMTFLKAMFKWCQAQNIHKSPVWRNTLKILIFFRHVGRKQKEGIRITFLPVIQKQIHICMITLLGRNACMGKGFKKKCEIIDWMMLPTWRISDQHLNVHVHIHCGIWGGSKNPSLTC